MHEGTRTVIHTTLRPEQEKAQRQIHSKARREKTAREGKKRQSFPKRLPLPERLLRSTAIACALLLGILTLRNLDQPWANAAMSGIESALTMRIDPDQSLGKLTFVRNLMPQSSLVFLATGNDGLKPAEGEVEHAYTRSQPWTLYRCPPGTEARTVEDGVVSAVSQMENGEWYVLIDHSEGLETLYGFLQKPEWNSGDAIRRGQTLAALAGDTLYFEMRRDGQSVDPEKSGEEKR